MFALLYAGPYSVIADLSSYLSGLFFAVLVYLVFLRPAGRVE